MADPEKLAKYLMCADAQKAWVTDKVVNLLSGEPVIPPFSAATVKLGHLCRNEDVSMDEVADVIAMDPGLASKCIAVASSAGFAARRISSIQQALMIIGIKEIRRIAFAMGVMEKFSHLKAKVDWDKFWLHSVMVARLTERVAEAFRPSTGSEYLGGLLHDCGKLMLEHYFPEYFDHIVIRATQSGCGHVMVEQQIIGVTHAQIGAAVCETMQAHIEVTRSVWFHHDPFHKGLDGQVDNSKFLAACVSVGDALANYKQLNIFGARVMDYDRPFDELPEWQFLSSYQMMYGLDLDLDAELAGAQEDLSAFNAAA
ncbi:MAG: HDOD domain-containing protein [Verrucomicrobiota bacterium]|nr:HDOD domain-containing protein [Verrucomicrobiota bacterium]